MSKSADAFRTISEVADWLGIPAHVLRFWESKFTQVKPVKRAGGRRYYRPADMQLLGGIRRLLHDEGMTIKGVQKIMREQGVRHVAAMSPPLDDDMEDAIAGIALDVPETEEPRGTVLSFDRTKADAQPEPSVAKAVAPDAEEASEVPPDDGPPPAAAQDDETVDETAAPDRIAEPDVAGDPASAEGGPQTSMTFDDAPAGTQQTASADPAPDTTAAPATDTPVEDTAQFNAERAAEPPARSQTEGATDADTDTDDTAATPEPPRAPAAAGDEDRAAEPDAPRRAADEDGPAAPTDAASTPGTSDTPPAPAAPEPPAPRVATITVPDDPADDIPADASALSSLCSLDVTRLVAQRPALSDLAGRMTDLRARMSGRTR